MVESVQNLQPRDPNQAPVQAQPGYNQQNYQGFQNQGYSNQYQQNGPRTQYQSPAQPSAEPSQDQVLDLNVADDDLPF